MQINKMNNKLKHGHVHLLKCILRLKVHACFQDRCKGNDVDQITTQACFHKTVYDLQLTHQNEREQFLHDGTIL